MPKSDRIERIVVIGGVSAGISAASQARRRAPEAQVVLLEAGANVAYGPCGIPYNLADPSRAVDDLLVLSLDDVRDKRKIDARLGYRVTSVDLTGSAVYATDTSGGREYSIGFDRLVFATGAEAVQPAVDGIDRFKGIFPVRSLAHAQALKSDLEANRPRRALVVGAGPSGLELAHSLRDRGLEVTVAEREADILPDFGAGVARAVEKELEGKGVRLVKNTSVLFFKGHGERVSGAETDQGFLDADVVVLAAGFRPRTDLAAAAGIRLGANGAIDVDRRHETSVKGVFACGDCSAVYHRLLERNVYWPMGVLANKTGRVAGANAAGADERFPGTVGTIVFTLFGLEVARTGLTESQALAVGYHASQTTIRTRTRGHAFPNGRDLALTLLYDERSGRVLGATAVGGEFVARRIDVVAAALAAEFTLDDLSGLDLAYTPTISPVWDPVLVAATVARKTVDL